MSPDSINDFLLRMFVCVVFFGEVSSLTCGEANSLAPEFGGPSLDNKLALSPLVFTGRLTASSSPTRNNSHYVSLRVLGVHRGRISKRLRKTIRLEFALRCSNHLPAFNPRSSRRKYLFFVSRGDAPGTYIPLAAPVLLNRKAKRILRKTLCKNCLSKPFVRSISVNPRRQITEGGSLKLKCILSSPGIPGGLISWAHNSHPLSPNFRISIRHKKKRSVLRIQGLRASDSGSYSCSSANVMGSTRISREINVLNSGKVPSRIKASKCPIESFCLNQGTCSFYEMIGELVCKCQEGFAGQRCQFKKAKINLSFNENASPCGLYSHDYHLREICAAWRSSPELTEMTLEDYREWIRVEKALKDLKKSRLETQLKAFKTQGRPKRNP